MNVRIQLTALTYSAKVGGFEIAFRSGRTVRAAADRDVRSLLDGFISGAAGLVACAMAPEASDYLLASHCSAELGHRVLLAPPL